MDTSPFQLILLRNLSQPSYWFMEGLRPETHGDMIPKFNGWQTADMRFFSLITEVPEDLARGSRMQVGANGQAKCEPICWMPGTGLLHEESRTRDAWD